MPQAHLQQLAGAQPAYSPPPCLECDEWGLGSVVQVVVGAGVLLLGVLHGVELVDAGPVVGGVPPEGDVQVLQEQVHACTPGSPQDEGGITAKVTCLQAFVKT